MFTFHVAIALLVKKGVQMWLLLIPMHKSTLQISAEPSLSCFIHHKSLASKTLALVIFCSYFLLSKVFLWKALLKNPAPPWPHLGHQKGWASSWLKEENRGWGQLSVFCRTCCLFAKNHIVLLA